MLPPVDVINSGCGIPAAAKEFVFNATQSLDQPRVPDIVARRRGPAHRLDAESPDGAVTSNMAIVPNFDGSVSAYAQGTTQLILDISSYFAP